MAEIAEETLKIFVDKNIDFVDALLCAYSKIERYNFTYKIVLNNF